METRIIAKNDDHTSSWGENLIDERKLLLDEYKHLADQLREAREADDRKAVKDIEEDHLRVYEKCAVNRAKIVNSTLTALRMVCEDDPGTVAHHLGDIVRGMIRDEMQPVAEAVAQLEARR